MLFNWQLFSFYEYARRRYVLNGRVTFSGLAYLVFPCHVPTACVLVHFCSRFTCFLTCTNVDCRLVPGYLFSSRFSFCLVDSSLCLPLLLMLTRYSLSTRLPSRYLWTLTHYQLVFLLSMFVLVSCRPLYIRLGMGTCSPSSIYFATTLKVWPARSHVLSLVLFSSLAKATALRFLGVISSVDSLTGSEVQPTQCTSVHS